MSVWLAKALRNLNLMALFSNNNHRVPLLCCSFDIINDSIDPLSPFFASKDCDVRGGSLKGLIGIVLVFADFLDTNGQHFS